MKYELFKNIDESQNNDIYSNDYVLYLINKIIYLCKGKKCTINYIVAYFEKVYGNTIKISRLKQYVNDYFEKEGVNNYVISNEDKAIIKSIIELRKRISSLKDYSEEYIYYELAKHLSEDSNEFIDIYAYYSALEMKNSPNTSMDVILSKFYTLWNDKFLYTDEYDLKHYAINTIDDFYLEFSVDYIVRKELCLNILSMLNINSIYQLKEVKKELIDLIFIFDKDFYNFCKCLSNPLVKSLEIVIEDYKNTIDEKEDEIIKLRYGYKGEYPKTLEEIGAIYSLTRERIRQLEARTLKKIQKVVDNNKVILCMLADKILGKRKIVETNEIYKYIGDEEISSLILLLYKICDIGKCGYNNQYNCLYNLEFGFDNIIKARLKRIPEYLSKDNANLIAGIDRMVFEDNYKEYHNMYIRKNMIPRDVFISFIKKHFPNGYRCSTGGDYEKLKSIVYAEVGDIDDFPGEHSLAAMIDRDDTMILYERGSYITIDKINDLPEEMYQRIIDYIYKYRPAVYYNSIYSVFKKELQKYNINNPYLLKGLIDRKLPDNFHSRRDYIAVGDRIICPYERIMDIIHSFNKVFSINDLRKKFPGMEDYVFYNILYPEKENGLIFLENKRFIYFEALNIKEEDKNKLKQIIDGMFTSLNSDVISARKIYARIKLLENSYDLHLNMVEHYFDLYSVIQLLFPNDYYYSRPFISTNPEFATSREELVRNHLINFDSFSYDDVKNYLLMMNIGGLYSYLMFMDSMSDNFVQVDIDKMVKKELICIDDNTIRSIKKVVNLLITNFKCIDTRKFNGYSMFPKLKYSWNKYLLVGIVRTYLSEDFIIDYTENKYKTTDFIIRRDYNE